MRGITMGRIYIDKYTGKIERTDLYFVRLTLKDGTVYENLEPRKLFPITNNTMYITLLDSHEKEVAMIKDLAAITDESRAAVEDCFFDFYMIPEILEVLHVEDKFGVLKWLVKTDRGEIEFTIRNRHSDIKCYDGEHMLVRDSNDNRYLTTISKLDKKIIKQ